MKIVDMQRRNKCRWLSQLILKPDEKHYAATVPPISDAGSFGNRFDYKVMTKSFATSELSYVSLGRVSPLAIVPPTILQNTATGKMH